MNHANGCAPAKIRLLFFQNWNRASRGPGDSSLFELLVEFFEFFAGEVLQFWVDFSEAFGSYFILPPVGLGGTMGGVASPGGTVEAGRHTAGGIAVGAGEENIFGGELVESGRAHVAKGAFRAAIDSLVEAGERGGTLVIGDHPKDVRLLGAQRDDQCEERKDERLHRFDTFIFVSWRRSAVKSIKF